MFPDKEMNVFFLLSVYRIFLEIDENKFGRKTSAEEYLGLKRRFSVLEEKFDGSG